MLLLRVENGCAGGEGEIIQIGRHRPDIGGERDDLVDYPNLRQKIVEAITTTESWRELYDAVSYKDLQY